MTYKKRSRKQQKKLHAMKKTEERNAFGRSKENESEGLFED